jgi:hypothetical protein
VDGKPGNSIGLFLDCDSPFNGAGDCFGDVFRQRRNPVLTEYTASMLAFGINIGVWDNYHQTDQSMVQEPTFVPPEPGCPECVHVHWRWGEFAANPTFGGGPAFGDPPGRPLIPPGSNQSLDIAVTRWHAEEEDPTDYLNLVLGNPEPIIQDVVFWYSSTGYQDHDSFFTHGGFFNPAFRDAQDEIGLIAVAYFNLFEPGPLTATPIDPATAGPLPTGYTVYNNLAYDISTEAVVSGPHTVSINVPSANDPEVFSSLRILHGEKDPSDPNRMILVDRTILPPDLLASNFDTKVIRARVNSFSPFVIARVSDTTPPSSTAIVTPRPNANGWNNGNVTVTINSTDNSAVRLITYTNALNGVTTTVAGATVTFPVTIEGGNEITYYATDQFGNVEAPKTVFVNIDRTPPAFLFIGTPNPEPNVAGWNNSDVSIGYATFDDGSGVFPFSGQFVLSTEGAAVQGTITVTDVAGNSASEMTPTVKIDKTAPVTTHNVNVSGNQATVTLNASDNLSGVAATSYSVNGGATQTYSGPFTLTGAGSYTITYSSTDVADNTEATKTAIFTIGSQPRTVTLVAVKDSFLRDGADDTNEGANERLRIQNSGNNRALVAFDLSGISTANLVSATLVMNIAENSDNWGANGRLVDVQRLLVDWTQGNGRNDVMAGGGSGFRGTGEGVTWKCAKDSDIHNQRTDCATPWNGGNFAAATATGVLHRNGLLGEVRWDVTADVRAGAGFGWIIKKRDEGQAGQVRYYSLEGAGGNTSLAPRLVLVFSN